MSSVESNREWILLELFCTVLLTTVLHSDMLAHMSSFTVDCCFTLTACQPRAGLGHNAPLIWFLILALDFVCLLILYAFPLTLFSLIPYLPPPWLALCGLWGVMCPWFDFWFRCSVYILFACLFLSYASPLTLFSLFPYLSPPLFFFSFENRHTLFQAGCRKKLSNLALDFCVYFVLGMLNELRIYELRNSYSNSNSKFLPSIFVSNLR